MFTFKRLAPFLSGIVALLTLALPLGARAQLSCGGTLADCDGDPANGCETDLATDPANCGACQASCSTNHIATPTCTDGVCSGICEPAFGDCNADKRTDGCETPLNEPGNSVTGPPIQNCGACGETCNDDQTNPRGACTTDLCVPVGGTAV